MTILGNMKQSRVDNAYSTVGVACISVFDVGAQRLSKYSVTSDPMWTTVGLRQGGYCSCSAVRGFQSKAHVFSAPTKTSLKPCVR